jgi:DNA-binding NarL/FixJ family response regulator
VRPRPVQPIVGAHGRAREKGDATRQRLQWYELGTGRPLIALTPREREVLTLLASGWRYRHIAAALRVSIHTVEEYAQNARCILGAKNHAAAVAHAIRNGLLLGAPPEAGGNDDVQAD